jgi:hypothetical protein
MSKPVFISYNFLSDREFAHNIRVFFQPYGPCHGTPRFVSDVAADDDRAVDVEIRRVMNDCVAAVFVCGQNSHNSPWINREAQLAISLGLGIVALQAPNTTGGVPAELKPVDPPIVPWGSDALCAELNRILARVDAARDR